MGGLIAGIIGGIIGLIGGMLQNQGQQESADKQMAFQADQNATSVQRRVEDLKASGLNPGLAYSQSAASGSGAQAVIGNVGMAGMTGASSAAGTSTMLEQLKLQSDQTSADIKQKRAGTRLIENQQQGVQAATGKTQNESNEAKRIFEFNTAMQPFMQRQIEAATKKVESEVPGAQNRATVDRVMGRGLGLVTSTASKAGEAGRVIFDDVAGKARRAGKSIEEVAREQREKVRRQFDPKEFIPWRNK